MARDFMTGFLGGFQQAGGVQRLGSLAARNIDEGQHYNLYDDPLAMQAYQQAQQIGTESAKREFTDTYGQYVSPDEGDTAMQTFFPEDITIAGLPEEQYLNTVMQGISQGMISAEELPEIQQLYEEATGKDFATPFYSAFMQPETTGFEEMMGHPAFGPAMEGWEAGQDYIIDTFGEDIAPHYDVPGEFANEQEQMSYLRNALFPAQEEQDLMFGALSGSEALQMITNIAGQGGDITEMVGQYQDTFGEDISPLISSIPTPEDEHREMLDIGWLGIPGLDEIPMESIGSLPGLMNAWTQINQLKTASGAPGAPGAPTTGGSIVAQYGLDPDIYAYEGVTSEGPDAQIVFREKGGKGLIAGDVDGFSHYTGPVFNVQDPEMGGAWSFDANLQPSLFYDQEEAVIVHPDTDYLVYRNHAAHYREPGEDGEVYYLRVKRDYDGNVEYNKDGGPSVERIPIEQLRQEDGDVTDVTGGGEGDYGPIYEAMQRLVSSDRKGPWEGPWRSDKGNVKIMNTFDYLAHNIDTPLFDPDRHKDSPYIQGEPNDTLFDRDRHNPYVSPTQKTENPAQQVAEGYIEYFEDYSSEQIANELEKKVDPDEFYDKQGVPLQAVIRILRGGE